MTDDGHERGAGHPTCQLRDGVSNDDDARQRDGETKPVRVRLKKGIHGQLYFKALARAPYLHAN